MQSKECKTSHCNVNTPTKEADAKMFIHVTFSHDDEFVATGQGVATLLF
jgi:hypothetical protein